jgi:release factor glutamine methyltransferase
MPERPPLEQEAPANPWERLLHHETYEVQIDNLLIAVHDGVFTPDPKITYTPSMILENLPDVREKHVADVGTGTGVLAIAAAKRGAKVVAIDIDPPAIKNAQENIKQFTFEHNISLLQGNLLEGVSISFDYIFANLPILDEVWDASTKATSLLDTFLEQARIALQPAGRVFIPWGSFAEEKRPQIEMSFRQHGFSFTCKQKEHGGYTWYLYTLERI